MAGDDEVVIDVKAVAVENVDKRIAAGTHYASRQYTHLIAGDSRYDGIGALPDGTLVEFGNPPGPMARSPRRPWCPRAPTCRS